MLNPNCTTSRTILAFKSPPQICFFHVQPKFRLSTERLQWHPVIYICVCVQICSQTRAETATFNFGCHHLRRRLVCFYLVWTSSKSDIYLETCDWSRCSSSFSSHDIMCSVTFVFEFEKFDRNFILCVFVFDFMKWWKY